MGDGRYHFPGRWIGGVALATGPLVWLTGALLRLPFHFFFPQQLAAYAEAPDQVWAAYSCVVVGQILVALGVATVAERIGRTRPALATWGGLLVVLGLFARTFHAGADHLAFQLVAPLGVQGATDVVGKTYGAAHVVAALNPAIMFGWPVLAVGGWRAGVLPWWRALALASMAALMLGVLKGSSWTSIGCLGGLAVALVPLGAEVLVRRSEAQGGGGRGMGCRCARLARNRLRPRPTRMRAQAAVAGRAGAC